MNIISIHNLTKPSMFILHWKIDKIGKLCSCTTGLRTEAKFSAFKVEPMEGNLRHHRFSLNRLPSPTRQRSFCSWCSQFIFKYISAKRSGSGWHCLCAQDLESKLPAPRHSEGPLPWMGRVFGQQSIILWSQKCWKTLDLLPSSLCLGLIIYISKNSNRIFYNTLFLRG